MHGAVRGKPLGVRVVKGALRRPSPVAAVESDLAVVSGSVRRRQSSDRLDQSCELPVVGAYAGVKFRQFRRERPMIYQYSPQVHECADDVDAHRNRLWRP